jgi:hypothetical protein
VPINFVIMIMNGDLISPFSSYRHSVNNTSLDPFNENACGAIVGISEHPNLGLPKLRTPNNVLV